MRLALFALLLAIPSCPPPEPTPTPPPTTTTLPADPCAAMHCEGETVCVAYEGAALCVPPLLDTCPWDVPLTLYVRCKPHGAWHDGTRWDCTPQRARAPLGGMPVWPEGPYRAACEIKSAGGYPTIGVSGATSTLQFDGLSNPWQFWLRGTGSAILHCHVPASSTEASSSDLCAYEVGNP